MSNFKETIRDMIEKLDVLFKEHEVLYNWEILS